MTVTAPAVIWASTFAGGLGLLVAALIIKHLHMTIWRPRRDERDRLRHLPEWERRY